MKSGDGDAGRHHRAVWEIAELRNKPFTKNIVRGGFVDVLGRKEEVDAGGYVTVEGLKYMVLAGVNSPELNVEAPYVNVLFDATCSHAGNVTILGNAFFCGKINAKNIKANSIRFGNGLDAVGLVFASEGDIRGRGDVAASEVKAKNNVSVSGEVSADLVMARQGYLSASGIRAYRALGFLDVIAMTSGISPPKALTRADGIASFVWANEGSVSAVGDISTGQVCAGRSIMVHDGELSLVGDAFCWDAKIGGRVTDYFSNESAPERVYCRNPWVCEDNGGKRARMDAREIAPGDLGEKMEKSPFAIDNWRKYYMARFD